VSNNDQEKTKFYVTAISVHVVFIFSIFMENVGDSLSYQPWGGWITTGIGAILFFSSAMIFYVRPDIFFISYRIFNTILHRTDSNQLLLKGAFYLLKIISWLVVLILPILFLLMADQTPGTLKLYLMFGFYYFLMVNGNFLFRSYEDYCLLKQSNKWGILSMYEGVKGMARIDFFGK
jgi:hypothetical protein